MSEIRNTDDCVCILDSVVRMSVERLTSAGCVAHVTASRRSGSEQEPDVARMGQTIIFDCGSLEGAMEIVGFT